MMEELRLDEALSLTSNSFNIEEEEHQSLRQNKRNKMRTLLLFLPYLLVPLLFFLLGFITSNELSHSSIIENEKNPSSMESGNLKEEEKVKNKSNQTLSKTASNEDTQDDHLNLSSYTYANCPFTMTKFSQFEMAKTGNFKSKQDRRINSMQRAKMALDLSNDARAYERVVTALEYNAFNRTIVLDGDSLTRQLFISLSCLAWTAGYVTDYNIEAAPYEGDTNAILKNSGTHSSSKTFGRANIILKGGGTIYYVGNGSKRAIDKYQKHLMESCMSRKKKFEARNTYDLQHLKRLSENDILLLAAGHHTERELVLSNYKEFLECVLLNKEDNPKFFQHWPHFLYQSMSNENFWTINGMYGEKKIPGKDQMSCQPSVTNTLHRTEEREILKDLVPFIGYDIKVEDLGEYHVEHGDCLHWIQPGVPDLYAAEIADFVLGIPNERDL